MCRQFTDAALGLSLTILNSLIDLVSFSGILYSIYPPLFAALLAYSVGGTLGSIALGKVGSRWTIADDVMCKTAVPTNKDGHCIKGKSHDILVLNNVPAAAAEVLMSPGQQFCYVTLHWLLCVAS